MVKESHNLPHCLESEEEQEGHHQTEETHGFRQSESQDGIGEKLLLERWVSGITNDEGAENCSNTSSYKYKIHNTLVLVKIKIKCTIACLDMARAKDLSTGLLY